MDRLAKVITTMDYMLARNPYNNDQREALCVAQEIMKNIVEQRERSMLDSKLLD